MYIAVILFFIILIMRINYKISIIRRKIDNFIKDYNKQ